MNGRRGSLIGTSVEKLYDAAPRPRGTVKQQEPRLFSIYQLKPAFQNLLRPLVRSCAGRGITANAVTLTALIISLVVGAVLIVYGQAQPGWFLLLPLWMFFRMAFNAVDGMLAREFGQQSALGAYLNELCDVIADAALYLPFAFIAPFSIWSIGALIWLAALSEMTGALGPLVGAPRAYHGPMGKSDRAFVFGCLGLLVGLGITLPAWCTAVIYIMCGLMGVNMIKRIRAGISVSAKP
ncbi:MAG TPA: CDP-alcohol phosphatidyltransferase family protein [Cellvibrionaceae bacterium]|nr:CDP-alcohol phosphatidyltransferase family protein [Cellvibrionaceae bacterium]